MVKDPQSTELANGLADLCQSVVEEAARRPNLNPPKAASGGSSAEELSVAKAPTSTTLTRQAEQAILWGSIGAFVGGSIGGPAGALIGAGVGAAVGSCGDSDTTITVQNNGGSPA